MTDDSDFPIKATRKSANRSGPLLNPDKARNDLLSSGQQEVDLRPLTR